MTGLGVRGKVDGRRITIGSHRYFEGQFEHSDHLCAAGRRHRGFWPERDLGA